MADYQFNAPVRSDFGKGFARRARAAGSVPSVIYSKGETPLHIMLPMHEVTQAVRLPNALFEVEVEGSKYNALVKHVQRDFVTRQIEHVDLLEVDSKQIVTVAVELKVEGETKPGSKAVVSVKTVEVHTPAGSIPRNVILDIDGSDIGAHFKIADIKFPDGVVSAVDDSRIIVAVKELAKKKETQIDVAGGGSDADAGASDAA